MVRSCTSQGFEEEFRSEPVMQIDWTKSLIYNQNVIVSQLHFLSKILVSHKRNYNIVFADDFSSENQQNAISFGIPTQLGCWVHYPKEKTTLLLPMIWQFPRKCFLFQNV